MVELEQAVEEAVLRCKYRRVIDGFPVCCSPQSVERREMLRNAKEEGKISDASYRLLLDVVGSCDRCIMNDDDGKGIEWRPADEC